MSLFYLIRHGMTDSVGQFLAGREGAVPLNEQGQRQVEQLADYLATFPIDRIYTSPLPRAQQSAAPLAERLNLQPHVLSGLNEVDFGDWTGQSMAELAPLKEWQQFNQCRSVTRIPNGEPIWKVQSRVVSEIDHLHKELPHHTVALFSHADVIKAAVCYYLGVPLDFLLRFEISPASISVLRLESEGAQLLALNRTLP